MPITIQIHGEELFDDKTQMFSREVLATVTLEHSLVSVSKWEAKYEKPFISEAEKTVDEVKDYVKMMLLEPVSDDIFERLDKENFQAINDYIGSKQTATWINDPTNNRRSSEQVTSELIYYWMVALTIPFECQYWHLNRLLTLIQVANIKSTPPKNMSKTEAMRRQASINAQRKAAHKTRG